MAILRKRLFLAILTSLIAAGSPVYGQEEPEDEDANELTIHASATGKDLDYVGNVPLPDSYRCVDRGTCKFADFLLQVCALVVVQHDKVVYHYFNQTEESDCTIKNASFAKQFGVASVAKSITSTLLGLARADELYGPIDLNAKLVKFQPGYEKIPGRLKLEHALRMRGGLKADDNGEDAHEKFYGATIRNPTKPGSKTFLEAINTYADDAWWATPGVTFRYSNMTSAAIGTALESILQRGPADGPKTLAEALQRWIWDPVGMAGDATWKADKADSPSPYCCLKIRAYDLAKFGTFILKQRTTPEAKLYSWLKEATRHDGLIISDECFSQGDKFNLGYRYQWWTFEEDQLGFTAIGTKGQFLHIMPEDGLVIVQFSTIGNEKYNAFQCDSWSVHSMIREALAPH